MLSKNVQNNFKYATHIDISTHRYTYYTLCISIRFVRQYENTEEIPCHYDNDSVSIRIRISMQFCEQNVKKISFDVTKIAQQHGCVLYAKRCLWHTINRPKYASVFQSLYTEKFGRNTS